MKKGCLGCGFFFVVFVLVSSLIPKPPRVDNPPPVAAHPRPVVMPVTTATVAKPASTNAAIAVPYHSVKEPTGKVQHIRALASPGQFTEDQFKAMGLAICKEHSFDRAYITFLDEMKYVDKVFDRDGLTATEHNHWLCTVTVLPIANDQSKVHFELAWSLKTKEARTDVVKPLAQ